MTKRFRATLPMLLMALASLLLTACSSPGETMTGVRIDVQGQALTLTPGDQLQLLARATGSGGSGGSVDVDWQSSQAGIASVDATGLVTALAAGEAIITARSSGNQNLKDQIRILVTATDQPASYRLSVIVEGNGSVMRNPEGPQDGSYVQDASVSLTAVPAQGWRFAGWHGSVTGSDNPLELTIGEDLHLTAMFSYRVCSDDETVTFEDEMVEKAVRTLFKISSDTKEITCSQVQQQITSQPDSGNDDQELANVLNLNRCDAEPINSLEGLQHLVHLVRLELSCNGLDDISQLAGLTSLVELNLDFNEISDLTPLAGLKNLEVLGLYDNEITDLAPLSGLANLRILYASENYIKDVSPLADLQKLEHLWLYLNCTDTEYQLDGDDEPYIVHWGDCLTDVRPLATLSGLRSLILAINEVEDISAISGMEQLQLLHASGNRIGNADSLEGLPALQTVKLDTNLITSLAPLAQNIRFPARSEPFSLVRGTVRMPNTGVFASLTIHHNCLDISDAQLSTHRKTITDRNGTFEGFDAAQLDHRCTDINSSSFEALQLPAPPVSINETLQQLRQSKGR